MIKIVKLVTGQDIIGKLEEASRTVDGKEVFMGYSIKKPQIIEILDQELLTEQVVEESNFSTSIVLKPWVPFSDQDRHIIPPNVIVTISDPIADIEKIYTEKTSNG